MSFENLKSRLLGLEGRILEDEIYRLAWEEIEGGEIDSAAQARAIAEGAGDDGKIRAFYIKHRVRRLKDEWELISRKKPENPAPARRERSKESEISSKKQPHSCSFCGVKLGLFNKSGGSSLCRSCLKKVTSTIHR